MNGRTLVKVTAGEHCICFRTVSRERRSPNRFYVLRSELAKLETQASVISHDIWSFAVMRRDAAADLLEIQFTWLGGSGEHLHGWEETVTLPYSQLAAFVEDSTQEGRSQEWKALSIDISKRRPKFIFDSKKTLQAIINNGVVRRKLVRFLRDNFRWPSSEQIHFYADFVPYSFTFQDICNGRPVMTGGLILHGQEDMGKAYYSMLSYLDGYPIALPARYANRQACYETVYLISNIDLTEQYPNVQANEPETWKAFLRRIQHVIEYRKDGPPIDHGNATDYIFPPPPPVPEWVHEAEQADQPHRQRMEVI